MSKTGIVKGYKVFDPDWTCSPNGNTKQYTCPGKFEENINPIGCRRGMHFCKRRLIASITIILTLRIKLRR